MKTYTETLKHIVSLNLESIFHDYMSGGCGRINNLPQVELISIIYDVPLDKVNYDYNLLFDPKYSNLMNNWTMAVNGQYDFKIY